MTTTATVYQAEPVRLYGFISHGVPAALCEAYATSRDNGDVPVCVLREGKRRYLVVRKADVHRDDAAKVIATVWHTATEPAGRAAGEG